MLSTINKTTGMRMKSRIEKNSFLINRPIAHRGLHGKAIGENTQSAFENAIRFGYPIETDVQLTKDGEIVCFHDDNVRRVTGVDKLIWDMPLSDVRSLRISGTSDGVMKFSELLELVN